MSTLLKHKASVQATANETALRVARGQIRHLWHLDSIKQTFESEIKKVLIGIGSANKVGIEENPFWAEDRKQILIDILKSEWLLDKCSIYYLMDFGDNDMWRRQIENEFEDFSYVVSDNDILPAIFHDKKIIKPEMRINIRWTTVRNAIYHEDFEVLGKCLHPTTFESLKKIDAYKKIQGIFWPELMKPKLAADIVIKDINNKTLFIERINTPFGIALPGGMIDYGETGLQAALREWCEEIGGNHLDAEIVINGDKAIRWWLTIQIIKELPYRDDPKRDPRGPVISFPFEVKILSGEPKAADDAKDVMRLSQEEIINLPAERWAFPDHKDIALETYPKLWEDVYLNEENCINRLIDDYKKYESLAISYDFDNTIYDRHQKWYTFNNVIALLKEAKEVLGNSYFNVFTANSDLELVKSHIIKLGLPLDGINQDPPFWEPNGRKPFYSILLDDRAGLPSAYRQLKAVVEFAKNTK